MAENDFSRDEVLSMQEDAIRRVRDMQHRANENLRRSRQPQYNRPPGSRAPQQGENNQNRQEVTPPMPVQETSPTKPVRPLTSQQANRPRRRVPRSSRPDSVPPMAAGPEETVEPIAEEVKAQPEDVRKEPVEKRTPHDFNPLGLLEKMDQEKVLLLLLIVTLLNEGADTQLILALGYLLI